MDRLRGRAGGGVQPKAKFFEKKEGFGFQPPIDGVFKTRRVVEGRHQSVANAMGGSSGVGVAPLVGAGGGRPLRRLGEAPLVGVGGGRPGVGPYGGRGMAMGGGPGVGGVKSEPPDIKTEASFKPV